MMLQLPIWRYPAVVIFSLALHGILLLIIFSEYRRNPPPSQIEWFDLREMTHKCLLPGLTKSSW